MACRSFREQILEKSESESSDEKCVQNEEEMKSYFYRFAKESVAATAASSTAVEAASQQQLATTAVSSKTQTTNQSISSSRFMAKRIYKGYTDDPRNTGNTNKRASHNKTKY